MSLDTKYETRHVPAWQIEAGDLIVGAGLDLRVWSVAASARRRAGVYAVRIYLEGAEPVEIRDTERVAIRRPIKAAAGDEQ